MRKKGQHFLVDRSLIERIANYSELIMDDRVLEIGPGTGNLTEVLSAHAGWVFAVEADPALAANLQKRFPNVEVANADALKFDFPDYNKVVSNIPYQISSKITYRLLSRPFQLAVLMFQREFVRRLTAFPGSRQYGRLAMAVGYFCNIEILEIVSRSSFRPVPEVESSLIRLRPKQEFDVLKSRIFLRLVEGLFNYRRKKVKTALSAMGISKKNLGDLDAKLLEKRPEELTPDETEEISIAIF